MQALKIYLGFETIPLNLKGKFETFCDHEKNLVNACILILTCRGCENGRSCEFPDVHIVQWLKYIHKVSIYLQNKYLLASAWKMVLTQLMAKKIAYQ